MPTTAHRCPIPLGIAEAAEFLGYKENTVSKWKYNREETGFPDPDGYTSRTVPYWWPATMERWARETGRWKGDGAGERLAAEIARRDAEREAMTRRHEAERLRLRRELLDAEIATAEAAAEAAERLLRAAGAPTSRAALAG